MGACPVRPLLNTPLAYITGMSLSTLVLCVRRSWPLASFEVHIKSLQIIIIIVIVVTINCPHNKGEKD